MVDPVDPTTRTSPSYAAPRAHTAAPAAPETPVPERQSSQFTTEIVHRESPTGELGINVVRVLNPQTGEPIYQSPPEGVLVMLETALWRLRKKDVS